MSTGSRCCLVDIAGGFEAGWLGGRERVVD